MIVDRKIIEGCISGKRLAQSKLYKVFSGVMLGVCLRYSTSTSEAEDILQEGFIKVFGSIKSLKNHEVIEGWIRRIMVNTAINHYHKKKIHFDPIDEETLVVAEEEEEVFLPIDPGVLMSMIQTLPDGYKIVLNLYVFEGFSHKEIAAQLGISENTSKTQLFKARNKLRKMIEQKSKTNETLVHHETRI